MNNHSSIFGYVAGRAGASKEKKRPWRLDVYRDKFVRYLSGGGLSALSRSESELEREEKQTRFLYGMLVAFAVWLVAWIW